MPTEDSGLPDQGKEISFFDLLFAVAQHKRLLIAAPIVAGVVALGVTFLLPNQYTATLRIAPSKNASTYYWLLTNEQTVDYVSRELQLAKHYSLDTRNAIQREVDKYVKVRVNAKDGYLDVAATDKSPEFAAKLANTFGKVLPTSLYEMRLLEASKIRYDLELRRDVAAKNRMRTEQMLNSPQIKAIVERIAPAEQYGIVSLAGIQAEAALQGGISDLAQSQVVKLQDQLSSLQRLVVEGMKQRAVSGDPGLWIAAVSALQEHAYWNAMTERLDHRIELARAQERDELKITSAEVPDEESGPKRILIGVKSADARDY